MTLLFSIILIVGALSRFVPHPANFAAIGALGIFAGLYAKNWKQALFLPISARLVSDLLIGFFSPGVMISVYLSTAIGAMLGVLAKRNKNILTVGSATIASAIIFFILTNFAVWQFDHIYPVNLPGLLESYTMALPFFRNSLLGDLFYTGVLVGGYEAFLYVKCKMLNVKTTVKNLKPTTK